VIGRLRGGHLSEWRPLHDPPEAVAVDREKDGGAELGEAVDDAVHAERGCLFSVEGDRSHAVPGSESRKTRDDESSGCR
jgi:hypothetical protein